MEHILTECKASGQETIWKTAEETWRHTEKPWPFISIGLLLGISLVEIKNPNGKTNKGLTGLFRIIVSESTYLIWLTRCEWRIGREGDAAKLHPKKEIENKWRYAINNRIRQDWAQANKYLFHKKAISHDLVKRTWEKVAEHPENPEDDRDPAKWTKNMGPGGFSGYQQ
ncbi:hypothetical protein CC1G_15807 [Coprinopsis cinerea okayama7|uniref:Uncharacterized protein n=1 Tax=Coprinopsis cinerea (strain Okayama-7 / 130 / ATCC MYA-4618 / FGSC 9003) TaxID=240176 RepID=D6RR10_COPC7|nr:hypothetical protein CC1G_15807 [Coprinopsis cinerea okayama7\|eukprot:XP_002910087.1 hypothetical protein CC1G_15807 [Coprinopsis cinerea okayama7\